MLTVHIFQEIGFLGNLRARSALILGSRLDGFVVGDQPYFAGGDEFVFIINLSIIIHDGGASLHAKAFVTRHGGAASDVPSPALFRIQLRPLSRDGYPSLEIVPLAFR